MGLRDLFRRPRPVILMYHRVARLAHDPWGLAVTPENFEAQMAYLASERLPLRMSDFVDRQRSGTLDARHVAITFDDAYLDNLLYARAALHRHHVPATVFAVTDALSEGSAYWWDEWARVVLEAPGPIDISLSLGDAPIHLRWDAPPARQDWRAWQGSSGARERAFVDHYTLLQEAPCADRRIFLEEIRAALGDVRAPEERSMTGIELRDHVAGGLIELGSHTRTHPPLARRDDTEASEEIGGSRRALNDMFGVQVAGFAYPYGSLNEVTPRLVEECGYEWACATSSGPVGPNASLFALPRINVGDWTPRELRQETSF